jgi:hypothetical protein
VTLLGLLGRAMAVALLFGVLLLPTADHHLADRLPGAIELGVHSQMTHHHGNGATAPERRSAQGAPHPAGAPLLMPLDAGTVGVAVPSPFADTVLALAPPRAAEPAPVEATHGAPPSLLEPPPLPPPVLPA